MITEEVLVFALALGWLILLVSSLVIYIYRLESIKRSGFGVLSHKIYLNLDNYIQRDKVKFVKYSACLGLVLFISSTIGLILIAP